MRIFSLLICLLCLPLLGCPQIIKADLQINPLIVTGAEKTDSYVPLLANQSVAIVCNQTSTIHNTHLVDSLLKRGIDIRRIFAPEHGFRGNQGNGEKVVDSRDVQTGLPIISLYGSHKKPTTEDLSELDVLIFDIQDVGARFYTYLSSLHYIMEACAEQGVSLIILDRPNPNGFYVDGPMLKEGFSSFVGMHPIPVVHGMTLGELANMIQKEGWLKNQVSCDLTVIPCDNYSHKDLYELPISPSPNLPNMTSIYLYPSLCFFEGTHVSIGRGTSFPFQVVGYPNNTIGSFEFRPTSIPDASPHPKFENEACKGIDLRNFGSFYFTSKREIYLEWLVGLYETYPDKSSFFLSNNFIDKLAGTDQLRLQLIEGRTSAEIHESWQKDLQEFKLKRKKYLLYEDFE